MDRIEELLPDLDNYLRHVLAKEKLSALAEKRRKYYVERLDIIKFNAPSLPPRPDGGLMKIVPDTIISTSPYISDRPKINGHVISGLKVKDTAGSKVKDTPVSKVKTEPEPIEENIYADMEDGDSPQPEMRPEVAPPDDQDMLYLVPAGNTASQEQKSWSDSDSGTSYESYGEEDQDENMYDNVDLPEDVPLPRISKKKKKKVKTNEPELRIKDLENILFRGELYHKGSWQWNKRYCVISDSRLLVYKTEKSIRPFINFVLLGYHITYTEKEGRRNHVLRIAHHGCESHFFAADLKEIADLWLEYLKSAACTEIPSSGDSANLPTDSISGGSTAPDQHSMSTGSEGGSGDGVVTQNQSLQQQQQQQQRSPKSTDEKKLLTDKDKKKKNIISDFLSGTFGKKKGLKMMKKTIELSDITIDPQAKMAGVMDVCHDNITRGTWCPRYCCVKDGRLECYYENASDGIEQTFSLVGADIQNAAKETRKELAIKLVWENGDSILLDTSDTIEHGKWLHALIMEREGIHDPPDGGATYENMSVMTERMAAADAAADDDVDNSIYDEVYDVNITTGKGDKIDAKTAHALSQLKNLKLSSGYVGGSPGVARTASGGGSPSVVRAAGGSPGVMRAAGGSPGVGRSTVVQRSSSIGSDRSSNVARSDSNASDRQHSVVRSTSNASDRSTVTRTASSASDRSDGSGKGAFPPPLPSSDPPKRPLMVKRRRSRLDDDGAESHEEKDLDLSEEMASAFTHIKSQLEDGGSSATTRGIRAGARVTSRATDTAVTRTTDTTAKSDDKGVIKCHLGPTIAEDKELLETTQNSILSVLREEKKKGPIDSDVLGNQIDDIKRQLLILRKQKSELRSKILTSRGGREKVRLETELHNMDQMVDNAEQEVNKLQLLAQEKVVSNLSRNSSFSSPSSSRSSSLRRDSGRPTTLKTTSTARPAPVKTSPRDNKRSVTSPREARYSSLREKNISAAATSRSGETKTSPGKSKVEAKSTISKVATGAGMSKSWAKSTASTSSTTKQAMAKFDVSGVSSSGKKTMLTSTRLEPLKVGTTRIRTVHTTTSVRSGSPQKTTAGQQRPRSPPESGSSRSPAESGASKSSPESGSCNGPKQNGQAATSNGQTKPRKVVQERLKLWEAMSEDSTC